MNQLSSIKERLKNFNDSEFQELCDSFLILRNRGYKAYSRTGAHDVKQKTTRGNPDSFFQMPNGLYLFVESTTTEHRENRLINKLIGDISSCLDFSKTKIPLNKIQEIILCYNSNLKPFEIEKVNKQAVEVMGKPPLHYSLERLASEIFFHHKNLASDYLQLPLDTGQVISLDKFVEEYDNGKQKLATPLSGVFLHRHKELKDIRGKLADNDILIISGPPGVGKSKLALKAIEQFIESHLDYSAYAISPKGADLLGDLGVYFDGEDNCILLVDDVNRVDKFEQILGFYRSLKSGKLKLVLTVRDYALENVREWLSTYENSIVEIGGFSFEEIKSIIEQEPLGVRNHKYQFKIFEIAKGNARLAVMMAIVAKRTNKLDSLNNVADLFEQYFETFISDEDAFKNKQVLKALGIVSFFNTLPYNDSELLDSISNSFSIPSNELRGAFDKLHSLDLIELNYQHIKIGEQNLSTYFFYKVFIKDQLLSFESLWNNYFELQEHRFKDTVYPMYQNFGNEFIREKIKPVLLQYWESIQLDEIKAFRFLNFAWEFLPDQSLAYLEVRIDGYLDSNETELKTKYETNDFASINNQEKHLHLLANFLKKQTFYIDALDLSFQLVKKHPKNLPQLIYHIDQNFIFIDEDYINHFERQATILDYLKEEVDKGKLQAIAFFAVSKKMLKQLCWTYKNKAEAKRDDLNIASVKKSRGKILDILLNLYSNYPEEVFAVMLNFSTRYEQDKNYTFAFDLAYLIPWIDNNLNVNNFRHCYYVQEMIRSSTKEKFKHPDFDRLKTTFAHPTYSLFELIIWDRRRGKEDYDFEDYREFEALKTADIAKALTFKSKNEVKQFITRYREIIAWDQIRLYSQQNVVDAIILGNLLATTEFGFLSFVEFAKLQDENILPSQILISYRAMDSLTAHSELVERFWKIIELEELSEIWKIEVLTSLPIESITKEHLTRLHSILNEIKTNFSIQLARLKKYEQLDPKILSEILCIVVRKIEEENLKIWLRDHFFVELSNSIEDIKILKKAYLQQDEFQDHFDYYGEGLLAILKRDETFLLEFIKEIFGKNRRARSKDHKELAIVWKLSNVEELLDEAIEYMANTLDYYFISDHFANAFFQNLTDNGVKADKYLLKLINNYSHHPNIIHIAFDIIHETRKNLFEVAFSNYILKNQDLNCFKEIKWTDNQIVFSGNAIVGAIRAAKWEKLLKLVENMKLGTRTRAIRNHIKSRRDNELEYAEHEKRRKFLNKF